MPPILRLQMPSPIASVRVIGPGQALPVQEGPTQAQLDEHLAPTLAAHQRELSGALSALSQARAQLSAIRQQVIAQAEGQLVELAISIASKVLMQEIQAERYQIEPIVSEALASVNNDGPVVVRLNPADFERCSQTQWQDQPNLQLVADPSIAPAQCQVQCSQGVIESSIEAHLRGVAGVLTGVEQA